MVTKASLLWPKPFMRGVVASGSAARQPLGILPSPFSVPTFESRNLHAPLLRCAPFSTRFPTSAADASLRWPPESSPPCSHDLAHIRAPHFISPNRHFSSLTRHRPKCT